MKIFIPTTADEIKHIVNFVKSMVRDYRPTTADAVMATVRRGQVIGAVIFQNYRHDDIELVCAGEPGWLSKETLRVYFTYPFGQLGCRRVTVVCHRMNKKSRDFVQRRGFKLEGVHRKAMPDGRDAMSYGMLKDECRWL